MNATTVDIRSLFQWEDPEVIRLAEGDFGKCILGKVHPPEGELKHQWIAPGGGYYGQWIWDTMFVVDLLSIVPGTEELIRDVFQNYWDSQERWNRVMPDYTHGMVACAITPGTGGMDHRFSQIPILAWGVERVYRRNGDKRLLAQCIEPLEKFHDWYWRERDVTDIHLAAVGAYADEFQGEHWCSGTSTSQPPDNWYKIPVQQARFEALGDFACELDDLHLTQHPARQGGKEGFWYGDICVPGITAYLILAEKCLSRLAEIMGDHAMARRRRIRADQGTEAARKHMWDEEAGVFLAVRRDTLEKIPVATIGSWIPLHAGIPTERQAKRMAEVYQTPHWQTALPIPTVDRLHPLFQSGIWDAMWRGDVWPAPNYQVADGLAAYGYTELAADVADKTIANALKNGVHERYEALTGKGLGVDFLGMSGTIVTLMLDGLSKKHRLRVRAGD
jgi:putative isomerase